MRSADFRSILLGLVLLAPIAGLGAEHVVLESNSPAYTPGQTLDAATPIVLMARQFIIVATDDGRLIRVEGPHAGPAAGPVPEADAVREAIGQLFGRPAAELGGLGGVRGSAEDDAGAGTPSGDSRDDPWSIHAGQTGDQCFVAGRPLQVWRDGDAPESAELTELASDAVGRIDWRSDRRLAAWPQDLAPIDEGIYLIRPDGTIRSVAIRLHALEPAILDQGLATVAWLAAKGCMPQARLLLRRVSDTTAN